MMKFRSTLFPLIFTFLTTSVISQEQTAFIRTDVGLTVPVGSFAGKNSGDGFAIPGIKADLEGAWLFSNHLGIGAIAGTLIFPVDAESLTRVKLGEDSFMESLNIRSESYLNFSLTPQFYYRLGVGTSTNMMFKAGAGISYARSPYQLYKAEFAIIGKNWYEITSASNWTWNVRGGLFFGWNLNKNIGLSAGADLFYSPVEFGFRRSDGSRRVEKYDMFSINPSIGLLILINRKNN